MAFEFFKAFFAPIEPQPIENLEDKRKAVERFCLAQGQSCGRCNIAMKIPMCEQCYGTDEEVDRTYRIIYGTADPKIINGDVAEGQKG